MVSSNDIAASKAIQQRTGKTFYVATRLLPERVRQATYVLYAFFRIADDVVDDPDGAPPERQRRELQRLRQAALGERESDDPVLSAFNDLKETYAISDREVEQFIDAMVRDIDGGRYETHADLEEYLRGSSVAVAYMMLAVMAGENEMDADAVEAARPHAKALGEAFQLTNFLRDVREDIRDYGRIYLPETTLTEHDVTVDDIRHYRYTEHFAGAVRAELRRTERLYRTGVEGIQYLPRDCQFAVLLAAVLYADHHRLIRANDFDTLSTRPTLSMRRRLTLAATTWYHWRRADSPSGAFRAASAVPALEGTPPREETSNRTRNETTRDGPTRPAYRRVRNVISSLLSRVGGVGE